MTTETTVKTTQETTQGAQPQPGQPSGATGQPAPKKGVMGDVSMGAVISGALGLLGSAAGAGWPGIVAMVLLGLALPFGWGYLVKLYNRGVDKREMEKAGADAGMAAVDLANQGTQVTQGLDAAQQADAPTEGFRQ